MLQKLAILKVLITGQKTIVTPIKPCLAHNFLDKYYQQRTDLSGDLLKRIEKKFDCYDKMKIQLSYHSKNIDSND